MAQVVSRQPATMEARVPSRVSPFGICGGQNVNQAVPWLRRLVVGLQPRRPGFDPGSVHVGFVMDKVTLGQVFPQYFGFPLSVSFQRCSITSKNEKTLIVFITGCTISLKAAVRL
jgi:hypothetical protein